MKNLEFAAPGSRAYPGNKSLDEACGARLDFGETYTGSDGQVYRNVVLQANKNAKNAELKKIAARNSHQKLGVLRYCGQEGGPGRYVR